jgi:hypothetical protein
MQFFLVDVGTAAAAFLGYLALVAVRRRAVHAVRRVR